jgi:methionyl-tRNA formyltransferase
MKSGVTIHEIDEHIDHGPIILQREYRIKSWDTSGSAYSNIMKLERDLLLEHFPSIRDGAYRASPPATGGNINYKKDFEKLKRLDLDQSGTFGEFLNRLRALSHEEYRNAFFVDEEGNLVFVRVILEVENR